MIVVIDNYDSFVHNLSRYFRVLGYETVVVRNDSITIDEIISLQPEAIVISPGPCSPNEAGISLSVVKALGATVPILGICLGHQTIGQVYGATVTQAQYPRHGRDSVITYEKHELFAEINSKPLVGRYHSLVVKDLPDCLLCIAKSDDDQEIMAIVHEEHPVLGLQFHPESLLTQQGLQYLKNFLNWAKMRQALNQTVHASLT
ncbi:MAG: aminodeoxychorismate/anthranilate synthase component II [Legionellales bacterium]|nr:aminodeoxychorismate/anthranilate synthase component II [Legionellales bacterium]|tara:strand:+ start:473 stop:1081 length:609 start_codon:yes stop_codon:yes gene_type:complete